MKKVLLACLVFVLSGNVLKAQTTKNDYSEARQNLKKAMSILDNTMNKYYNKSRHRLAMHYNFTTNQPEGVVSVWEYTSAIEAHNSVMEGLVALKEIEPQLYETHFNRYQQQLEEIIDGLEYYAGSFKLTSYTGTNEWKGVYGVHRAAVKGFAKVADKENVYDDQMWIIRELIRSYKLTQNQRYLDKAEFLTAYVLDGWDCNLDGQGDEYGGITWGPGYTSRHACSNSPLISPLVWLSELYVGKDDTQTYYVLDKAGKRVQKTQKKQAYYLEFAKKIYDWQKRMLYVPEKGACWDAVWADSGDIIYREKDGVKYRVHLDAYKKGGTFFTYNIGTMISGLADLYRATQDATYKTDLDQMVPASFRFFAPPVSFQGKHYNIYPVEGTKNLNGGAGSPWFNDVLLRGYIDASAYNGVAKRATKAAQTGLDYGYEHHLKGGIPPIDLFNGWKSEEKLNVMYALARASDYGMLVRYSYVTTGIDEVRAQKKSPDVSKVYDLTGRQVNAHTSATVALTGLKPGVYIVDGQKRLIK